VRLHAIRPAVRRWRSEKSVGWVSAELHGTCQRTFSHRAVGREALLLRCEGLARCDQPPQLQATLSALRSAAHSRCAISAAAQHRSPVRARLHSLVHRAWAPGAVR
jgi:hypothetical protein